MNCWNHARPAVAICSRCGRACCEECANETVDAWNKILCVTCIEKSQAAALENDEYDWSTRQSLWLLRASDLLRELAEMGVPLNDNLLLSICAELDGRKK